MVAYIQITNTSASFIVITFFVTIAYQSSARGRASSGKPRNQNNKMCRHLAIVELTFASIFSCSF